MKKISLILLILWMGVIFLFSCEDASSSQATSIEVGNDGVRIIKKIIGHTKKYNSANALNVVKTTSNAKQKNTNNSQKVENHLVLIRKSAHVFEFFILGILMTNFIRFYHKTNIKLILISTLCCILYAAIDEFHQLYVPGRTGRVADVFIDSIGIITGVILFYIYLVIKQKISNRKINEPK